MTAWLFDAYPHPRTGHIVVWVKHGDRVTKRLVPYRPTFCLRADAKPLEAAEALLARDRRVEAVWRDRSALWLRGPPEPVLRVRPRRFQDTHAIATDLRRATKTTGFLFFDVDHAQESRWMHGAGLWSLCRLRVGPDGVPQLRLAEGEDRWTVRYPDPDLRCLSLAVETVHDGPPGLSDPLLAVRLGDERIECAAPGDGEAERAVLRELGRRLRALDPDVLLTRHGDRFHVPFLLRRIRDLGLAQTVWLGRDPDPHPERPDQAGKSIHTYGRWLYKTPAYYLRGRWHIDLAKKSLDSEDDRSDVHGVVYLARVSNRRAQDVNRNGAGYALQQMQVDVATEMGVALPWKRNLAEDWKDAATLCAVDRGGQTMVPEPGVHEDVAACDFSGYYPSLVVRHNLSSDTINCRCCPGGPVIPELGYHVCTREHPVTGRYGHQSYILARLWPHRRWAKTVLKQHARGRPVDPALVAKARAIKSEHKALGVVCFGYFRYRNARFGCAEVHQAIQCYGRDGMTRARTVAQRLGFEVVHELTDCLFARRPGATVAHAEALAAAVSQEVGVPMDVEGVFRWVVFLPSKTHSTTSAVGVPNRYYGKFHHGGLKVRGIEVQRHSTPKWVDDVQRGMLAVLAEADDAAGFLARVPAALEVAREAAVRLRGRRVEARDLAVRVQATRSVEEYRASTNARAALRRLREAGVERRPGEFVAYVVTRGTGPSAGRVVPLEALAAEARGDSVSPDVGHYLRLLARSVETLLAPFGLSEEGVRAWLEGRARSAWAAQTGKGEPSRTTMNRAMLASSDRA